MARTTLAENVADVLRHAIHQGVYLSGERLVELTLAQEMNVSQNTVRDALRLLEQDGLVEKRARLGTYVRAHTPEEAEELYTLWLALESLQLHWAMQNMTPEQISILRQLASEYAIGVQTGRLREAHEKRFQFHRQLVKIADKPHTASLLRQVRNQIRLLENVRQSRHPQELPLRYARLLEAIINEDPSLAMRCLRGCILDGGQIVASTPPRE